MLDFGWSELLLIMALAILVMGPEEIPKIMLTLGRVVRRIQYIRFAFTQQFDEFLKAADLHDINKQVNFEARAPQTAEFDEAGDDEAEATLVPTAEATKEDAA